MHTTQVLDRLVAVNLDVRIWSGRKKLTAEDLSLGADVPPEDLVSLGSKRVCDPAPIKVFQRLKQQAERICLTGGMRFLGGYAIPEERTETVAAALDALGERFEQERATFVAGYAEAVEDWIALHPAVGGGDPQGARSRLAGRLASGLRLPALSDRPGKRGGQSGGAGAGAGRHPLR